MGGGPESRHRRTDQAPCQMRRESGALSTSAIHTDLDWKQEVNQRLAAHKSRRDSSAANQAVPAALHHGANSRAAQAAARVAARFAHAPSYNQVLAEEARAAVRAADSMLRPLLS